MIFEKLPDISAKESWEGALPPETNEQYHARRGYLSSSQLKEQIESSFNFKMMVLEDHGEKEPSEAFDLGSSVHEVLLTGDTSQFVVMPKFEPVTVVLYDKDGTPKLDENGVQKSKVAITIKAQVQQFESENQGKRIITEDQHCRLLSMVSYIRQKPQVYGYLSNKDAICELGFLFKDPETGIPCKFRPDIVIPSLDLIIDYKTCADVSPYGFRKAIERYYYHVSEAHYRAGYERVFGRPVKDYLYLAQQSSYPFSVALHRLSMASVKRAIDMRRDLMRQIYRNSIENHYPDFIDRGVQTLELAGYAFEIGGDRT